jgi:hypothetical protein
MSLRFYHAGFTTIKIEKLCDIRSFDADLSLSKEISGPCINIIVVVKQSLRTFGVFDQEKLSASIN